MSRDLTSQETALSKAFTGFLVLLSFFYFSGFLLHIADVLDLRLSFSTMSPTWKLWIVSLLAFDLLTAIGLFRKRIRGEIFFLIVSCSQIFAYTQFPSVFGEQNFLILFHIVTLSIYATFRTLLFLRIKGSNA